MVLPYCLVALLLLIAWCLQCDQPGPHTAYVDDVNACQALRDMMPSLQHIIADITHVMRRFNETLTPHHEKIGTLTIACLHQSQ